MIPLVYVYATDGYTETSIEDFLKKINPDVHWVIRSPRFIKRTKKDYAEKDSLLPLTGRTGVSLEEFMLKELKDHPVMLAECGAILLEDDLDDRDVKYNSECPECFIERQHKALTDSINHLHDTANCAKLLCLYAAPEIETWLIEDWNNSFGCSRLFNQKLATQLKTSLNLVKQECGGSLECYSRYFKPKFSDWLIEEIKKLSIDLDIIVQEKTSYSKRYVGSEFLKSVDPTVIEKSCRTYFAKAYHEIRDIT